MLVAEELKGSGFTAGIVTAEGVRIGPSPEDLEREIAFLVEERAGADFPPSELRTCIRHMLRKGGFKPTGRNKPASEYLARAADEGTFPRISNLVDVNNYVSLLSGLPASILDADALGETPLIRLGREGEGYVFNAAGQAIDVKGLVCVCRRDGPPLGNPVKDSMEAKVGEETERVVGVIYASSECVSPDRLEEYARRMARMLESYCGAARTQVFIV